jgi:hypothetical protein
MQLLEEGISSLRLSNAVELNMNREGKKPRRI